MRVRPTFLGTLLTTTAIIRFTPAIWQLKFEILIAIVEFNLKGCSDCAPVELVALLISITILLKFGNTFSHHRRGDYTYPGPVARLAVQNGAGLARALADDYAVVDKREVHFPGEFDGGRAVDAQTRIGLAGENQH